MNYLIESLSSSAKFEEYIKNVKEKISPITISGLSDVGKIQYIYATKENT